MDLKEAANDKKKKRAEKARRRHKKEKEIARRVWAGENRSDMEAELESEEPMEMCGDASTFEHDGDQGIVTTSVEHRELTTTSVSGERDTERRDNVPMSRKHATSSDSVVEREVKRARFSRP